MFTVRYALSPYIKQRHFVFKGLIKERTKKTHYIDLLCTIKMQTETGNFVH